MNQEVSKKVPRIFTVFGEFVGRFSRIGYLLAALTILVALIVIFRDFKNLSLTGLPGYFMTISAWFWLSLGFVKFSKDYAQGIKEGRRGEILSFILLTLLFCVLSGITAFYRYSTDLLVFAISVFIFAASFLIVISLIFGLIFYWNRLEGGINIYDE